METVQEKRKKTRIPLYLAILIIGIAVSLGFYWYSWQRINYELNASQRQIFSQISATPKVSRDKAALVSLLAAREKNGKYGEWPLATIFLSEQRGNPFRPKLK